MVCASWLWNFQHIRRAEMRANCIPFSPFLFSYVFLLFSFFFFEWHQSQFPFWEGPLKSLYKPPPFQPDWLSGHCPFSPLLYHSLLFPARDWRSTAVHKVASHYFSLTGVSPCYLSFLFCYGTVIMTVHFLLLFSFTLCLSFCPPYWGLFLCLVIVALAPNPTLTLNPKP